MNYWQINAYIDASELDNNERLIMLMNVMAVAFGGNAKQRQQMANGLLGAGDELDVKAFESVFSHLASPVSPVDGSDDTKAWAATEFDFNDPAFKVK